METASTHAAQAAVDELTARFGRSLDRTAEQDAARLNAIRGLARQARKDPAAREQVERLLKYAAMLEPEAAEVFRAFYLDCGSRVTARQLAPRFYVCPRTIRTYTGKAFRAMCDFF